MAKISAVEVNLENAHSHKMAHISATRNNKLYEICKSYITRASLKKAFCPKGGSF